MRTFPATRILLGGALLLLGAALWYHLAPERPARSDGAAAAAPEAAARDFLRLSDGKLPNVVLLTVDTLRADHVSSASFPGLTPTLDRLAASGASFLHTTTPAPATRPALAALHTGAYGQRHGMTSNFAAMPEGVPLLAEILQQHGYATTAFYGNQVLKPVSGFGRGFATYTSFVRDNGISRDGEGVDMTLAWLASAPQQPWFLWLHLMSPHGPYNSSPRSPVAAALPDPLPDVELRPSASNYGLGPIIPTYQIMRVPPRAKEYRQRYRDEVIFVDAQIERVVGALETLGLRESTLVIFTADHGEGLGEHDYYFQHGWLVNEPSVHVPMIWSQPGRIAAGQRLATTTSLVDVVPTLLAGLDFPAPPVDGRSLGAALAGDDPPDAPVFVLTAYLNQMTAVRRGRWKLVHTPAPPQPLPHDRWHDFYPLAESWALHDLALDPAESRDVSAEQPEAFAERRKELVAWERRNGVPSGTRDIPKVDDESLKRLRALGYTD